ncbi:MAG: glycosyltransferase family 4 protein [Bacteroidota bacterium]
MPKTIVYIGNRLAKKGNNVTSIETLGNFLANENYRVIKYSSVQFPFLRLIDMLWGIVKNQAKADFILIDTYSSLAFWFAYLSAKLSRAFNIVYIPILRGGDLPKRLQKNPKQCRELFGNAYVNIAPSPYLLSAFEDHSFQNLRYIPNTIEIKNYRFKKRKEISPKLLWVRAFSSEYNPLLALQVLAKVLNNYPQAKLTMIGPFKDDSIDICRAYAKQHQLPVEFTGGLPKQEWIERAADCDLFINTTNVDNTPVSVIEAMALGLPVVTTNVGGIPYLLSHGVDALLVKPDNANAMCSAIEQLLSSPDLVEKIAANALTKVQKYDWEVVKKQWFDVFDSIE